MCWSILSVKQLQSEFPDEYARGIGLADIYHNAQNDGKLRIGDVKNQIANYLDYLRNRPPPPTQPPRQASDDDDGILEVIPVQARGPKKKRSRPPKKKRIEPLSIEQ